MSSRKQGLHNKPWKVLEYGALCWEVLGFQMGIFDCSQMDPPLSKMAGNAYLCNELNLDRSQWWPIFSEKVCLGCPLHCHFWQHCFYIEIIWLHISSVIHLLMCWAFENCISSLKKHEFCFPKFLQTLEKVFSRLEGCSHLSQCGQGHLSHKN